MTATPGVQIASMAVQQGRLEMGNAPFVKAWEIKEGQQGPGIAVVGHGLVPVSGQDGSLDIPCPCQCSSFL